MGYVYFFGDAQSCTISYSDPEFVSYCRQFLCDHDLDSLTILKQVHGSSGAVVVGCSNSRYISLFEQEGDFLVVRQRRSAIAVLTADCLPVVVYDQVRNIVGVAHAGWRGSVAGVVPAMVQQMQHSFNTNPSDLKAWFGPAARSCCYEVSYDFVANLDCLPYGEKLLVDKNGKLFFDCVLCNFIQLEQIGVISSNINVDHCMCTICNGRYHSYRRDGDEALRQLTIAWLDK